MLKGRCEKPVEEGTGKRMLEIHSRAVVRVLVEKIEGDIKLVLLSNSLCVRARGREGNDEDVMPKLRGVDEAVRLLMVLGVLQVEGERRRERRRRRLVMMVAGGRGVVWWHWPDKDERREMVLRLLVAVEKWVTGKRRGRN